MSKTRENMSPGFAVFNLHVNNAGERADKEFVAQFGQKKFDEVIAPLHEKGIMAIFNDAPTVYTSAWVALVTAFVNGPDTDAEPVKLVRSVGDP